MARVRLTDRGLRGLETEKSQETFWDKLLPGFGIRVSGKTGRKKFVVRYRANGAHRRLTLGEYPHLSLADARDKARKAITDAQAGEDPQLERQQKRSRDVTFGALAREVLDAKAEKTRKTTQDERERILKKDLLPAWKSRPVASITRRDVLHLVEGIKDRGAPIMANKTLRLIQLIFNTGLRRGFPTLEGNPAAMMDPPGKPKRRDRYLTPEELKAIWKATEAETPIMRGIFRITFLTAQRVGAVCAMRWDHIDDSNLWTIPADIFKGKRPHLVPLSAEALGVLEGVPKVKDNPWVFPGRSDGSQPHVNSTNSALRRVRKRTKEAGIPHWTLHDARRTFRTHASRPEDPSHPKDAKGLGIRPEIADAVLGHKEQSVGYAHYQSEPERYRLAEKREALSRWGGFVRRAVTEEGDS